MYRSRESNPTMWLIHPVEEYLLSLCSSGRPAVSLSGQQVFDCQPASGTTDEVQCSAAGDNLCPAGRSQFTFKERRM